MSPEDRLCADRAAWSLGWSAGWYWQTDPRHRLSHVFGAPAGHGCLGRRPWELPGVDTRHPDWAAQFDALMARRPFENVLWRRMDASGRLRQYLLSGEPMFGPKGRFRGFRGVGHEASESLMTLGEVARSVGDRVSTIAVHAREACEQSGLSASLRTLLEEIEQAAVRALADCQRLDDPLAITVAGGRGTIA